MSAQFFEHILTVNWYEDVNDVNVEVYVTVCNEKKKKILPENTAIVTISIILQFFNLDLSTETEKIHEEKENIRGS